MQCISQNQLIIKVAFYKNEKTNHLHIHKLNNGKTSLGCHVFKIDPPSGILHIFEG